MDVRNLLAAVLVIVVAYGVIKFLGFAFHYAGMWP